MLMRRQIAICIAVAAMLLTACGAEAKEKKVADEAELVDIVHDEAETTEPAAGAATEDGQESGNADEAVDGQAEKGESAGTETDAKEQKVAEEVKGERAADGNDAEQQSAENEKPKTNKPVQKKTVIKPAAQPSNPDAGCVDDASDILTY
ncbi:MAG: hypothetical protein IJ682_02050 [Lachnospiraceae bacterium]|nr:hypothetical protein [Lachnospiraceae bacterium]